LKIKQRQAPQKVDQIKNKNNKKIKNKKNKGRDHQTKSINGGRGHGGQV
jgi:hypothetical protein